MTVPAEYKGMTFMENKKTDAEGKNRNLYCTGTFSQFTYWNYDRIPSKNDALSAALDWIDIADAVSTSLMNTYVLSITTKAIPIIFSYIHQKHKCYKRNTTA